MIAIGSDHAGFLLKEHVKKYFEENNIEYKDCGAYSSEAVDYPTIAYDVSQAVVSNECDKGIVICGTGIGISIACNKVKGIRAAVCSDTYTARMTRMHNDANVLAMGERVIGFGLALDIVEIFLKTDFEGDKHQRRVQMIMDIENA